MKAASGTVEVRLTLLLRSPEGDGDPSPAVIPAKAGITTHTGSSATRRNGVARKAASGTAKARLTLLLWSTEGVGYPSPAVIPAKAGITKHPGSSPTRRNGVPMKAASGTAEVRLTLFLRSPEGVGYPTPAVIPAKAGITTHTGSSATRRNGVPMKAASGTVEVRRTLLLRSPEGDRDSCLRRNDGGAQES